MTATYEEFGKQVASEKVTLAHIEPSARLLLWNDEGNNIYSKRVGHFVISLRVGTTELTSQTHAILSRGGWHFDGENSKVYVRMPDDSNPQDAYITAIYRLFFTDAPYKLSYDLTDEGKVVDYEPLIASGGRFSAAVSSTDQLGIALESSGQIALHNSHGYFDPIFDKLFFEQKPVRIYSWSPALPYSEAKLLFDGEVTGKSFDDKKVTFKLKDFIHKLRQPVKLGTYSADDGTLADSVIGKPKRAIYGKVKGVRAQSIDMIVDGFALPGSFSFTKDSDSVTSTSPVWEVLSPGDEIKFTIRGNEYSYGVKELVSDTELALSETSEVNAMDVECRNLPDRPYRRKNRKWMVSGHKLRQPVTTISRVRDALYFFLADISDFEAGDNITVNGVGVKIVRIVGQGIVIEQQLGFEPQIGMEVEKNPVDAVWYDKRRAFAGRDYRVENTDKGCSIVFTDSVERNLARIRSLTGDVTFTSGNRMISGLNTVFGKELQSRDWIRSTNPTHPDWYEILEVVDDTTIKLRRPFAGMSHSSRADGNLPNLLNDRSILAVDCIGKEDANGTWVRTASDVVKDLLLEAGIDNIEIASFANALIDAPYTVSLKLPLKPTGKVPLVREAITLINKSVFGSLVNNPDYRVSYKALTPDRPPEMLLLKDDDILDFSVRSKTDIIKKFTLRYAHFDSDPYDPGKSGAKIQEHVSAFVENLIGTPKERTLDVYLFNEIEVRQIIERYALFHQLSQAVVSVKAKLNLVGLSVGDKVQLQLARLYERFGDTEARIKVGVVNKIVKSGTDVTMEISDLGNIFNRVACVCEDGVSEFADSTKEERVLYSYICDDSTETPSETEEEAWGCNVVG